ncbi:hypothetical protein [Thermocrinis minervae]|uniref:Uncharacterized protein n=1 Tax=Thermocrinis minervae TaxID=381751 RepID=A0A1M6SZ96_9AQUI|nr:hypothetical protein [Thermocrinis minervae]SHK49977.1 hypothetical protein SAMN05444391_1228 [Thermocrinis minervae]
MRRVFRNFVLTVVLVLTFIGIGFGQENLKPRIDYQVVKRLDCKHLKVTLTTHCLIEVMNSAYRTCLADDQYVLITNEKESKKLINSSSPKYSFDMFSEFVDENEDIVNKKLKDKKVLDYEISEVMCYTDKKGKPYIGLEYYRGGNCAECTYLEVYDEFGNLVISDREKISLSRKNLPYSEYHTKLRQIAKNTKNKMKKLGLVKVKSIEGR